ncbi:hypothetical protein [Sphingomonas hengshuiensis]|uniref:Uncharacterized protein n=1 Tax=Sphingomonas hengshuiensis TaxID=1609977 RepID=A0A7U4J7A3_9SPHN|nr:hypothetical protein [Sphingomonas hengshuiensis]AJP71560.1 hypothetical protein TS85_06855 [Sphingomonas hengshuiensis]
MRPLLYCIALMLATPALAQVEQLEQIEPSAGEMQAEIFGGPGGQSIEALAGISDRLALGGEVEFEDGRIESAGLAALVRFSDPETRPIGLGVEAQASLGAGGRLHEIEVRGLFESRGAKWWLQVNPIVRTVREDGASGTGIAYAASIQRRIGGVWLGGEASGRLARIGGDPMLAPRGEQYLGPSITLQPRGGAEIGLAWLERIAGRGTRSGPRAFLQFEF